MNDGGNLLISFVIAIIYTLAVVLVCYFVMNFVRRRKAKNAEVPIDEDLALRSEKVVTATTDGVVVVDRNSDIRLINPAAIQMVGWGEEDALGLKFTSVVGIADQNNNTLVDETSNPILFALKNGEGVQSKDYKVLTKVSGKKIPVFLSVMPVHTDGSAVVIFRDIEKDLKDEQERSEFISTASHEMRTPVASIEGYLGLALNPATATIDTRAKEYLDKAHVSSKHLGRLFQDLLDVTKLDDRREKIRWSGVEATAFARAELENFAPLIRAKGIDYVFEPDKTDTGNKVITPVLYVKVDENFLKEVLDNLLENALKYTPQGRITVDVEGDDDNVTISVTDTGIGLAPEDLSHIFQKFYRVDNSDTREIGGTGLGLYISKGRIEEMGGKIGARSEYKKGSTFFISLPRIKAEEYNELRAAQAEQQKQTVKPQLTPMAKPITPPVGAPAAPVQPVAPVSQPAPTPTAPIPANPPSMPMNPQAAPLPPQPMQQVLEAPNLAALKADFQRKIAEANKKA